MATITTRKVAPPALPLPLPTAPRRLSAAAARMSRVVRRARAARSAPWQGTGTISSLPHRH
jgi:hypothetical protein